MIHEGRNAFRLEYLARTDGANHVRAEKVAPGRRPPLSAMGWGRMYMLLDPTAQHPERFIGLETLPTIEDWDAWAANPYAWRRRP